MIFVVIVLALSTLIFGVYIIHLHTWLSEAITDKNNAETLTTTIKKRTTVELAPGDTGLIYNYELQQNRKEGPYVFSVNFEVEIIEVSEKKVKVNAIDYTTNDTFANDPAKKGTILNFFKGQWINRSEIEIIYDERKRRNDKLNELGI